MIYYDSTCKNTGKLYQKANIISCEIKGHFVLFSLFQIFCKWAC